MRFICFWLGLSFGVLTAGSATAQSSEARTPNLAHLRLPEAIQALRPLPRIDRVVVLPGGGWVARIPGRLRRSDIYLFLARGGDGRLTITAFRGVSLDRDSVARIDAVSPRDADFPIAARLRQTDADERRWFTAHRGTLNELQVWFRARAVGPRPAPEADRRRLADFMRALDIRYVGATDGTNTHALVPLASMTHFSLGLMHSDDPGQLPVISPTEYYWIEPLGDGWYLYRRTS